ncbi:MAG: nucleotide exchange factor GrpE [Streptosporangiaceae bacterium]|jgi:molecular chaperone GrpE (heat shock protein)
MPDDECPDASAQQVAQRLDELTDLFRRRLLDDREKQRAFDALYRELAQARALAEGQHLVPLIRRLINVIDRLSTDPGELATSVAEELADILAMYEVEEIKPGSGAFDPRTQEVATVVDAVEAGEDGTVASVRRSGWRLGTRVLRPTLVDVRRLPDPA